MNKKRIGIFIALLAMVCMGLRAQSATSLRINEVLVVNDQNYQDDYGLHNAWIEIFNTCLACLGFARRAWAAAGFFYCLRGTKC